MTDWRKSSYSTHNGQCVEAASDAGTVLVRDTQDRDGGPVLSFTADEWHAFLGGARLGEFDSFGRITSD